MEIPYPHVNTDANCCYFIHVTFIYFTCCFNLSTTNRNRELKYIIKVVAFYLINCIIKH